MSFYAGDLSGPAPGARGRARAEMLLGGWDRTRRWLLLAGALTAALALGVLLLARAERSAQAPAPPRPAALHGAGRLPLEQRARISTAAGAASAAFTVRSGPRGTLAASGRGIDSTFTSSGVTIRSANAQVHLSPASLEGAAASSSSPHASRNRVTYGGAALRAWYANGPLGLEQGFTVPSAPSHGDVLRIGFAVLSAESPALRDGHVALGGGLAYGALTARDASGRRLPARIEVQGRKVVLAIDAAGARFPLHVDPFVFQEKLAGQETVGSDMAVSGDGNTALVGGAGEEPGAVDVFVRNGTVWTLQQKLSPGGAYDHKFGSREEQDGDGVALSGDGNTAMIVGYSSENYAHIWTYTRANGVWTALAGTLSREEAHATTPAKEEYGRSIALSYDGEEAAIGDPGDGYVFVLRRSGSSWAKAATLEHVGSEPGEWGNGLALSGDGKTVLVGAPGDKAVYFLREEGGVWKQEQSFEYPDYDGEAPPALALDREGDTALVGEYLGESPPGSGNLGAARIYTRSGSAWSLQASLERSGVTSEGDEFGIGVGLSEDGTRALVESRGPELGGPAVWEYTRSGSTWTQQGLPLEVKGNLPGEVPDFAVSGDARTLLLISEPEAAPSVYVNNPTVGAAQASEVTTTTALLGATVNPAGESVSSCRFEYGTTVSYGSTAACSPKPEKQTTPVAVSASLKGLTSSATYHFRVALTTTAGTVYDSDATFTTFAAAATAKTEEATRPASVELGALSAIASGGEGAVTVASYGSNPGPSPLPGSSGGYADIYRSNSASFTEVEFTDCEIGDARALWFYTNDGWEPAQPAATFSEGCGHFTATASSRPSVSELIGLKSKWGEPPGELGQCHQGAKAVYLYSEANCLTLHAKKGKPDGKGKYEWFPVPLGCYPMKKGRYADSACHASDEKKGKGAGSYEAGSTAFTGTASASQLVISGSATVECSAGSTIGELTTADKGIETLTLTGCSQSGASCTSTGDAAGTISTSPLETISYEEGGKYLLALTAVQVAQFSCGSTSYTLTGAVSAPETGLVNQMSTTSSVAFAAGQGTQQLAVHAGTAEHAATLTMTQSETSAQSLEIDSTIKSEG